MILAVSLYQYAHIFLAGLPFDSSYERAIIGLAYAWNGDRKQQNTEKG